MAPARQSTAQRNYSAVANGVSKATRWKIGRRNRRPRGLVNGGASCYRNGVLQTLLHLPKFVSWIMQHNVPGQNWQCRQAYVNPKWNDEPAVKELGEEGSGCVPCLLKDLVRCYWGNDLMNEKTGEPNPLPYNHKSWHRLHQLTRRWFYDDPPDSNHALNERVEQREKSGQHTTETEKVLIRQGLREQYMDSQQDADQFARHVFNGIETTFTSGNGTIYNTKRQEQFDSLFTRMARETRTCSSCNYRFPDWEPELRHELGFRVEPLPIGTPDDIASGIDRTISDTLDIMCPGCSDPTDDEDVRTVQCRFVTEKAPEYLWVVNTFLDLSDDTMKNRNPLAIPEELDITAHMTFAEEEDPVQMRYGLCHIVYHVGDSIAGGHYTAAVTRMPQTGGNRNNLPVREVFCDDHRIVDFTPATMPYVPHVQNVRNVLTVNPVDLSKLDHRKRKMQMESHDPYMLVYVRLPNRSEPKAPTRSATTATSVDTGSIADRVKISPRIRRRPA